MRSRYYNQDNPYIEGTYHNYTYIKRVVLEDSNEYMVFESDNGIRYFVEYTHYKEYNLQVSSQIRCLIDKINCTGRIFLEPEHPIYQIGEIYDFNVTSFMEGEDGGILTVTDCFNNTLSINSLDKSLLINNKLSCIKAIVKRIRKGVPEIALP